MLKLEKLEVRGFKSFSDTTEIKFHEGITAVVGPNGCGKSNILDSIAWVLGEQSAKSLRGSKMEDIIFNGTTSRKALSLAEVTLTLIATQDISSRSSEIDDIDLKEKEIDFETIIINNNPDASNTLSDNSDIKLQDNKKSHKNKKHIPTVVAGEKIIIGRKLYRSGDSEYLMNGHTCRLRDIQDFFAGTGLGGAQYAIIEQGHIGQILSSKPQERRALIEEAAGITKFKAKKHLAELKLEATKQNLTRLNDILAEIERQIVILKKQAAKARRYKRLREQIRYYLKYIFVNEYHRLKNNLTKIEETLNLLQTKEQSLLAEFTSQDIKYRSSQLEVSTVTEVLEKARNHYKDLQIESERTSSRIIHQQEQQKEINTRIIDFQQELQNIDQKKTVNDQEIIEYKEKINKINLEINNLLVELNAQETLYRDAQTQLLSLERELETLQNQLLIEVSKTEKLKHLAVQLSDSQKRADWKKQHLTNELIKFQEQNSLSKSEYERLGKEVSNSEDRLETFLTQIDEVNEQLTIAKRHTIEHQKNLDDLVRQHSRAEDRLNSLSQLNEKQAYFSESVQKLLGNKKIQKDFNLLATLADILNVLPKDEMLVERILGETLQTILVSTIEDAINAKDWLNKQKASRVSFLLVDNKDINSKGNNTNTAPDNDKRFLLDLLGLSSKHSSLFKEVFPDLSSAVVLNDLTSALKFSRDNLDILVFTSAGEQIRAGKLLTTTGAIASSSNVLQLKREIKELNDSLINLEADQDKAKAQVSKQREKESRLEQEKKEIDTMLRSEEKTLVARRVELSQSAKELERSQQQIKSVTLELEQTEKEIINLAQKVNLTLEEVEQAETSRQKIQNKVEEKKIEIAKFKPDVEIANQKLSEFRTINATQQERKKAFTQALSKLEDEKEQLTKRNERISTELVQLKERSQELKSSLVIAEQVVGNLEKEMLLAKKNVEKSETNLFAAKELIVKQEELIASLRNQISTVKEQKSAIQVENAQLQSELQYLGQNCLNELSENITEVVTNNTVTNNDLENNEQITDIASAQQLLLEARNKLSDLGPVNMMALDELTESEQRQTFLQQQYKDILASIHSTEEALREIKIRSRIKFREAFQIINANFSEMFQELFGGGRGEMTLINEEDVLESGIDINAQPPGKKLQNILLLSGGEKAMTALALVLGIFRFRPSPFCVLDEVDAPLDDMNIGRFTQKVKQMSEQTQFLVITHSKRTMEVASSIYGVTMQDPGVSKLISVKLG